MDNLRRLMARSLSLAILLISISLLATALEPEPATMQPAAGFGSLPLSFEANTGQTDGRVKFLARGAGYTLFLTQNEAVLSLSAPADKTLGSPKNLSSRWVPSAPPPVSKTAAVLSMRLLGASGDAEVSGRDELPGESNYFRGNDPKAWRTNISHYAQVRYRGVYPGVDLVYYGKQGLLEYDFVVAPQADFKAIGMKFAGAEGVSVDPNSGDLVVKAGEQEVRFHQPVAYQAALASEPHGSTNSVAARYVLDASNRVSFELGPYDHSRELVIDPALSYSTYLGGTSDDYGNALAVDSSGNVYLTGYTRSVDFPVVGAYQGQCGGGCAGGTTDAFVTKINSSGTALIYSTYLGGSGDDYGNGIALDSSGNAYIVGQTYSEDFPSTGGICGPGCLTGYVFVTKLNSTGSALTYSNLYGGQAVSQGNAIVLDSSLNAYITGYTAASDFPTTAGVFQPVCASCSTLLPDIFITKINSGGTALVYSSFLGGNNADLGYALALDSSLNAYVTGYTISTNFPTTPGAYQTTIGAQTAAFVTKINSTATTKVYSTYLGGSGTSSDACAACGSGIAVTSGGNAVVAGLTWETNFPTTAGAYRTTYAGGFHDAFVTEMNATGTGLVYSTYLGGSNDDGSASVAMDKTGNVYVRGNTFSTNFPVTPGSFQTKKGGTGNTTSNAFLSVLNSKLAKLLYSTYLGGSGSEYGLATQSIALGTGSTPNIYLTGNTSSTDFPVTTGAYQVKNAGKNDAFVSKFVASPNVGLSSPLNFGNQNVGTTSAPQNVTVTNTGNKNLTISAVSFTGTNAAEFSQTNTCSAPVVAGKTCTVSVSFAPAASGTRTASLSLTDNAPDSPELLAVSGVGVSSGSPSVTLSATSLTFPTTLVKNNSAPLSVTLTNSGTGTLDITSVAISGQFTQTNTCPPTVSAGGTCTITVTFQPTQNGSLTGTVTITDNAPDTPQTVSLTGTGTYVELVPTSLTFGNQKVGTSSPPQTVTLTNTDTIALAIKSVSIVGTNSTDFSQTSNCGSNVVRGASCTFTVIFTPTATGVRGASLSITDYQGGTATQTVPLTGTGTN